MQMALALAVLTALSGVRRTAILVACVYSVLQFGAALASRRAHRFADRFGGHYQASRSLWLIAAAVLAPVTVSLWLGTLWPAVVGFVALELSRNLWRPMTITRVDNETDAAMGATMLSIESQAKATGAMVLAPLIGYGVDKLAAGPKDPALWVAAAVALAVAVIGAITPAMKPAPADNEAAKGGV